MATEGTTLPEIPTGTPSQGTPIDNTPYVVIGENKIPFDQYKLKIDDGEEILLGDVRNGYLRHAKFTQGMQQLADQRRMIEGIYTALQSQLQSPKPESKPIVDETYATESERTLANEIRKLQSELEEIKSGFGRVSETQADAQLQSMLDTLTRQYPGVSDREIIRVAQESNSTDIALIAENLYLKSKMGGAPAVLDKTVPVVGGNTPIATPIDFAKASNREILAYQLQKHGGKLWGS